MTREEAIQVLRDWDGYFIGHGSDDVNAALNMAIETLETTLCIKEKCAYCPHCKNCDVDDETLAIKALEQEPRWIPISERLPEDDTEVIVSCTDDSGDSEYSYTTVGWHYKGMWVVNNDRSFFVKAWMPLPDSYEE